MKTLFAAIVLLCIYTASYSQIPGAISYQGIIIDPTTGETAPNGPHTVKFAFYDAPSNGNFKWETSDISVTTFKGLFTTLIPIPENTNWTPPLYVQLTVDGVVLSTRVELTTVPFAYRASSADQAFAMDAGGLSGTIHDARLSSHLQDLADGTLSGSKVGAGINAAMVDNGALSNTVLDVNLQDLADGTLSGSKVGVGINASMIDNGTLPSSVLNENLQDLADGSLSGSKIGTGIDANTIDHGTLLNSVLDIDVQDLAIDGVLSAARIENLNASKITAGTFDPNRIPSLDASKIATGTLADARIPNLNASKITSGTFSQSVLPSNSLTGSGTTSRIPIWTGSATLSNSEMTWNSVSNRLGINTTSPSATLDISDDVAAKSVKISNSSSVAQSKVGLEIDLTSNPSNTVTGLDLTIGNGGSGIRNGASVIITSSSINNQSITGGIFTIGGEGDGAHMGVYALSNSTGAGDNYGVFGQTSGTGTGTKFGVRGTATGSGSTKYGVYGAASTSGTTNYGVYGSAANATTNYGVYSSGDLRVVGDISYSGSIGQSSDRKLKQDIEPMIESLPKIMSLKPSNYFYRHKEFKGLNLPERKQHGLIAQDVEKIFPELVINTTSPEVRDEQGNITDPEVSFKMLDYTSLIPILIKGMQEQQAMIEELKAEVKNLKSTLKSEPRLVKASLNK